MTSSKPLFANNFLTIVLDMKFFKRNCSVFYFLSIDTKINNFFRL